MCFSVLFSPSEDKITEHNSLLKDDYLIADNSLIIDNDLADNNSLIKTSNIKQDTNTAFLESLWGYKHLTEHRMQTINRYFKALRVILQHRDKALLESIFGAKSFNDKNIFELHLALRFTPLLPAIELYNGVAFQGLSYSTLSQQAKDFILNKVLIFSNLFGVLSAKDSIPFYKLKQGTRQKGLTLKEIYLPFIPHLHKTLLDNEYIIDLRATIYAKLFMPTLPHFFFDFQKNGKTISHYAKLYRGKILRLLANNHNLTKDQCFEYLCNIDDENMRFSNYTQHSNRLHLIYEIL